MGKTTIRAALLVAMIANWASGQCNRGRNTGSASVAPLTATAFGSPFGAFSPISGSPTASLLAIRRSQMAQQQYLLARQQQYLQSLAQTQDALAAQLAASRNRSEDSSTDESQRGTVRPDDVRGQRRQRNAEKAFDQAERAESNGNVSTAKANYRRVTRMLQLSSELRQRAADAIARLDKIGPESARKPLPARNAFSMATGR